MTKREPGKVPQGEFSAFQQQLVREGYEVERYVRALFNQPAQGSAVDFQRTFKTETGMLARADVFALEKPALPTSMRSNRQRT